MKQSTRKLLLAFFFLISISSFGQNVRGFYITGIGSWLGNATTETSILEYAQGNGFNYILLYDLGSLTFTNAATKTKLASFISRAHTQYGMAQVGAVVEVFSYMNTNIIPYNNSRSNATEKFDVINQEFEFWLTSSISGSYCSKFLSPNGYSCDTAGAWAFSWKQFKLIDSACAANGMLSEVYVGWPNKGQIQHLASIADRMLVHAYRPTDADVYSFSKNRLTDIAGAGNVTKVMSLFSSEPNYMGSWLHSNPQTKPYNTYANDFAAETGSFKQNLNLEGYQWFTYQNMPKTMLNTTSITANGPLTFCSGSNVTLTATPGISYLWLPGGQTTQSITVSTPGAYTVTVTNASLSVVVSNPVVVVITNTGTTPSINASGPVSFCPGGSVTLTSNQASSYLWSNGATTQSITVSNTGNYSVTTSGNGGTCVATSAPVNVDASVAPVVPTVTASGSLNVCSGKLLTLTSSTAGGYLWSNGATTRTIAVSHSGNYFVNAYSSPGCSAQSAVQNVSVLQSPTVPLVVAHGSTTLTPANPTVDLISSSSASYLWSNSMTTRTITVGAQGTYRVTVIGANGCKTTSNPIAVKASTCTPPAIPNIAVSGSTVLSTGQSVTLTSSPGGGYLWSTGATTQSIIVSTAGSYSVRVYNAGSCFSTSLSVNISHVAIRYDSSTVNTDQNDLHFSVYPNPASEKINIVFNADGQNKIGLKIFDLTGRVLINSDIAAISGENHAEVDISGLPKGIYFAGLSDADRRQTVRVIVE